MGKKNAEYIRNLTSDKEMLEDQNVLIEYERLINKIESSIKSSKDIIRCYTTSEELGTKLISKLRAEGFLVKNYDNQKDMEYYAIISW